MTEFDKEGLSKMVVGMRAYNEAINRARLFGKDVNNYKICYYSMLNNDEKTIVIGLARGTHLSLEKVSEIYIGCGRNSYEARRHIGRWYLGERVN